MESTGLDTTVQIAKREFDLLHPLKNNRTKVRQATEYDVRKACEFSKNKIPNSTTDNSLVKKVIAHNADNIFVFTQNDVIVGIFAMLMLTPLGLERLLLGEFNSRNPDLNCLTKTGEIPAAIYVWSCIAPGLAAGGIRHVSQFLNQPKYHNINIFTCPVTKAGMKIASNLGYQPLPNNNEGLYRYVRLANRDPYLQRAA